MWCSVMQCGAVWCSVVQCGAGWCRMVQDGAERVEQGDAEWVAQVGGAGGRSMAVSRHVAGLHPVL